MNREIKFRAWDNVKNKMYYTGEEDSIFFAFDSNGIVATELSDEPLEECDSLEHLIYMQYTDLKDKNGKEIYEGDIVTGEESKIICEVIYTEGAMFMLRWNDTKWGNQEYHHYGLGAFTLEVIGNIYEDKHLLEG